MSQIKNEAEGISPDLTKTLRGLLDEIKEMVDVAAETMREAEELRNNVRRLIEGSSSGGSGIGLNRQPDYVICRHDRLVRRIQERGGSAW